MEQKEKEGGKRIVLIDGFYYPQRHNTLLFGLFKWWSFYYYDDIILNGSFTTLVSEKERFNSIEDAILFLNKEEKIETVYEK